jgi:DNA (cytosine-5)-methyltransferase 3A
MIDSADFSAQRRKRYYWTNINFSKNWKKSPVLFKDIEDTESKKKTRSIAKYKNTYKWSRDGKTLSWDTSGKGWYSQASRARTTDQKFNTVCACRPSSKSNVWLGNDTIRLITYKEMERLQTLPDDYTTVLSNKQEARGKCIGNGWTVNVVAHILCATTSEPTDKTYRNCGQQSFNFEEY